MAASNTFPAFIKLEHQRNPGAENEFVATVDRMMNEANRKVSDFSASARRNLDSALRVSGTGRLDLGVDELRAAAQAQEHRAATARALADATLAAAKAEGIYSQEMRQSISAAKQVANAEAQKAAAMRAEIVVAEQVQAELRQMAVANDQYAQSTVRGTVAQRDFRFASLGATQQLQDIGISLYSGQRASVVFAQQIPQLAFALTSLEGSANRTHDRIGRFATFLSGPWGLAVGVAVGVIGSLVAELFRAEEASDRVTDALDFQRMSTEELTKAIRDQREEAARSIQTSYQQAEAARALAAENVKNAISVRAVLQAELERAQVARDLVNAQRLSDGAGGSSAAGPTRALGGYGVSVAEQRLAANRSQIASLEETLRAREIPLARREAEAATDAAAAATLRYEKAEGALSEQFKKGEITFEEYQRKLTGMYQARDRALEAARKSDRPGRRGPDPVKAAQRLAEFAEDAERKIANIRDRFSDIPSEVEKSNRATRELDDIISDLERRKPEGFAAMVEEAERLKAIIPELGLDTAMERLREDTQRQIEVDRLLLAGREREAEVLDTMFQLEDRFGEAAWDRVEAVRAAVDARHDEAEALERAYAVQDAYLDATRSIKNELTSLLSGEGFDFQRIAKRLQGEIAFENIFGDLFKGLEDDIQGRFSASIDHVERENYRGADAVGVLARAAVGAANDIRNGLASPAHAQFQSDFDAAFGGRSSTGSTGRAANDNPEIVVQGFRDETKRGIEASNTALGMNPQAYFDMVGRRMVQPLLSGFEGVIGNQLLRGLEGVLGGAAGGYLAGGPVGAVLGGLRGAAFEFGPDVWGKALNDKILGGLGGAMQGAQTDAILGALGIQSSKTGAMIGGAAGSFLGPVGSILGSIGGGLLGGLFKSKPYGTARITGLDGLSITGNKGSAREGAGTLGGSVQEALGSIIDQLDAELGSFAVSIGTYKDNIRVSTRGDTGKLGGYKGSESENERRHGLYNFGDDMEAAIAFAVKTAIDQGAVAGLKASELSLLKTGDDLQAAMQDVFDFRDVFTRLKSYKDPVGAALDDLDSEFGRLEDLFDRANASAEERAQLAELYEIERAQAIEQAMERVGGSLRDLLKDLTIGDSGLSLRDRRANALTEYEALADRVRAGDVTAFDKYAEAARALLEIEREIFGSQEGYFDRFEEVRDLTKQTLEAQEALANASANRDSPFTPSGEPADDTKPVVDSIHWLGDHLVGELGRTLGDKLDAMTAGFNRLAAATPSTPRHASGLSLLRAPGNY